MESPDNSLPAHPASRHEAEQFIDLSDPTERERISPTAAQGFFHIMSRWKIRDEDARRLLGGMSNGSYYALKKGQPRTLGEDVLTRISYLLGIFTALNILYDRSLADDWMTLPNRNRIFGGAAPLECLAKGGLPAFSTVRRLLDARRVGN